jgi:hypothetical protein
MKAFVQFGFLVAVPGLLISGCVPISSKAPASDGFFVKTTKYFLSPEPGGGRELYYRAPTGRQRLVWKYVPGTVLVHGGRTVFIGCVGESIERFKYTYLAAGTNGPVVSIAPHLLTRTARNKGANPEEYLKRYVEYKLKAKDDIVQMVFAAHGNDQPDLIVDVSWDEIGDIIDVIAKSGTPNKDRLNGITYLE